MYQPPKSQPPEPVAPRRSRGGRKLGGSLAALSSAAIVTVYTVGYVNTHSSLDQLAAVAGQPAASAPAATPTGVTAARQQAADTSAQSSVTQALLRDGTYTGVGTSRHGSIEATVVVQGGKIVSASVTNCATRYPCSHVAPLVQAVVQEQAVPVTNISGATASSRAYKQAVSSALSQAHSLG